MPEHALLLAALPSLAVPVFLAPVLAHAAAAARTRLLVVLVAPLGPARTAQWHDVQRILTFTYAHIAAVAHAQDKILLDIDILLKGPGDALPSDLADGIDVVFRVTGDDIALPLPASITALPQTHLAPGDHTPPAAPAAPAPDLPPSYRVVAVGGTFDHLHAGHKILLSMAAFLATAKLIVGVTDDALLTRKPHRALLEPLPARAARLRAFLARFAPGLVLDVVPITDVYGPTGWDPDIGALVVSHETRAGADAIAAHRAAHGLPALTTFVIDVISATSAALDPADAERLRLTKMSSTSIREWLAAHPAAAP